MLKIVVKDRPGTAIDPTKVRILTYFYDQIDGKDIVLTDAQTAYAWVTPEPINWAGDKSEVLETTYLRPKDARRPARPPPTHRRPPTPAHASRRGARGARNPNADTPPPPPAPSPTPGSAGAYLSRLHRPVSITTASCRTCNADPVRLLQQISAATRRCRPSKRRRLMFVLCP